MRLCGQAGNALSVGVAGFLAPQLDPLDGERAQDIPLIPAEVELVASSWPRRLGPFLPPRRATGSQSVAAGQFSQSVGGTLSSSGVLVRQTGKLLAGTLASAGALAVQTQKTLSGALASAGTLARQAQKVLAGAIASDGALGALFSGFAALVSRLPTRFGPFLPPRRATGSTQSPASAIQQSVGGTLTSSGALVRRTDKLASGAIASIGDLVKLTSKAFTGTLTSAGSLASVRVVLVALTGAIASAGALLRQTQKTLSGALASAGALTSQLAGALARRSRHPAQLGPFFTLFRKTHGSRTVAAPTFQQSVGGTVTSSGTLTRRTDKITSGGVAPTASLVKRTSRALAGAMVSEGTLATIRVLLKTVAGAIASSGALNRLTGKMLGGSVGPSSALTRHPEKAVAGSIASVGVVTRAIARELVGVITSSGAVTAFLGFVLEIVKRFRARVERLWFRAAQEQQRFVAAREQVRFEARMSDDENFYTFDDVVKDPAEALKVELDLFGKCANFWRPNELYATNEHIRAEQSPGFSYEATTGGTSGSRPPTLPRSIGATVQDGSVTWTCRAAAANGLNPVTAPSAVSDPTGLTIANVATAETTKILATYSGGTLGNDYDAVFTFTLNGVTRIARQTVKIRKR